MGTLIIKLAYNHVRTLLFTKLLVRLCIHLLHDGVNYEALTILEQEQEAFIEKMMWVRQRCFTNRAAE